MSPRISVVVAARNAAATLAETLGSVQAQTFGDWEVVVADDGSSDATADIARSFGERVRVLRSETGRGPAAARNRAAREARGELLAILDADDAWLPEYLSSQLALHQQAVAQGRRVAAVCCDALLMGPDGVQVGLFTDWVGPIERVDLTTLLRDNVVFTSVLCPRSVFLEVGGYDEDPRLGVEDYDLFLRLAERGYEFVFNPAALVRYRLSQGLSSKVELMAAGGRLTMERALERGALTRAQRRIARKRRRVYGVVQRRARIAGEPSRLRRALLLLRAVPVIAVSALEHPERWGRWLRQGPRTAGERRHTGA